MAPSLDHLWAGWRSSYIDSITSGGATDPADGAEVVPPPDGEGTLFERILTLSDAEGFIVHRGALCSAQYSGAFDPAAPADHLAANRAWLQDLYAALRPAASGAAYQNYIDPTLSDWRQAYYGANYDRLVAVQKRYDPHQLLRFPQGIGA